MDQQTELTLIHIPNMIKQLLQTIYLHKIAYFQTKSIFIIVVRNVSSYNLNKLSKIKILILFWGTIKMRMEFSSHKRLG